jgi:DNA polymerase III delta prime subunit
MEIINPGADIEIRIAEFVRCNRVPHIIFHGACGTGKRTLVANMLFQIYRGIRRNIDTNVLRVNCAHSKGIKYIRDDIKSFARVNIQNSNDVPFKSIVLYNADHLTADAQSALRRSIELFSINTRFFIIVRDKHKMLTPILSRFCEIYVPETLGPDGNTVNLHQLGVEQISREHTDIESLILLQNSPDLANRIIKVIAKWYSSGICAANIHAAFASTKAFTHEQRAAITLFYHHTAPEIKNENMLMFFIVEFALVRSNCVFKI